jgi:hypothetical protein
MTTTRKEASSKAPKAPTNLKRAWTITMTDRMGNRYYLYRYGQGHIHLVSKNETPNCLSNISQDGARFRLDLERARNASDALQVVMNQATYAINAEIL